MQRAKNLWDTYNCSTTCNFGGSGFSWWWFQDGYWNTSEPGSNHYGMLERGYLTPSSSRGGLPEKLVANVFDNYIPPASVSSCGPCPVTAASLQSYNPALTYFNPFQHPSNPQNTIKGYIYDQDGNRIANAYVGGHTNLGEKSLIINNILTKVRFSEFQKTFTADNGYFELIPYDYIALPFGSFPTYMEGQLHTFFVTTTTGERIKYSEHWWPSNYCSNQMPPANDPSLQWSLNRVNYTFSGEFKNIIIPSGITRKLQAYHDLTVENTTVEAGAFSEIKAPASVHIKELFHATAGSETHVYCAPTIVDCSDYSGYLMENKMPGDMNVSNSVKAEFIDLSFKLPGKDEMLRIYPNPAIEYFMVERDGKEAEDLEIRNLIGELISKYQFQGSKLYVNCSHLPQGVYLIKSANSNLVYKLIKQ